MCLERELNELIIDAEYKYREVVDIYDTSLPKEIEELFYKAVKYDFIIGNLIANFSKKVNVLYEKAYKGVPENIELEEFLYTFLYFGVTENLKKIMIPFWNDHENAYGKRNVDKLIIRNLNHNYQIKQKLILMFLEYETELNKMEYNQNIKEVLKLKKEAKKFVKKLAKYKDEEITISERINLFSDFSLSKNKLDTMSKFSRNVLYTTKKELKVRAYIGVNLIFRSIPEKETFNKVLDETTKHEKILKYLNYAQKFNQEDLKEKIEKLKKLSMIFPKEEKYSALKIKNISEVLK